MKNNQTNGIAKLMEAIFISYCGRASKKNFRLFKDILNLCNSLEEVMFKVLFQVYAEITTMTMMVMVCIEVCAQEINKPSIRMNTLFQGILCTGNIKNNKQFNNKVSIFDLI